MFVIKRDGRRENVHFDKITSRINKLCYGLDPLHVDATIISQKVVPGLYPGMHIFINIYIVFLIINLFFL